MNIYQKYEYDFDNKNMGFWIRIQVFDPTPDPQRCCKPLFPAINFIFPRRLKKTVKMRYICTRTKKGETFRIVRILGSLCVFLYTNALKCISS